MKPPNYGYRINKETIEDFLNTEEGKKLMHHLAAGVTIIMEYEQGKPSLDKNTDFRKIFAKCFLHMLVGCDDPL